MNRLLAQSKVHQSQSAVLPDLNLLALVSAQVHDEINYALLYDFIEQLLIVCEQRNCQDCV